MKGSLLAVTVGALPLAYGDILLQHTSAQIGSNTTRTTDYHNTFTVQIHVNYNHFFFTIHTFLSQLFIAAEH